MRASAVGTWVCVPITALTRPSRYQPMAFFSLVISQWKSTMRSAGSGSGAPPGGPSDQPLHRGERRVELVHEDAAHDVDDRHPIPIGQRVQQPAAARRVI